MRDDGRALVHVRTHAAGMVEVVVRVDDVADRQIGPLPDRLAQTFADTGRITGIDYGDGFRTHDEAQI